jgi:hypothetical protein
MNWADLGTIIVVIIVPVIYAIFIFLIMRLLWRLGSRR